MNPTHPNQRGTSQGPDVFFQAVEKSNADYDKVPEIVQKYMDMVGKVTGRNYKIFEYYGAEDAERVVVVMGGAPCHGGVSRLHAQEGGEGRSHRGPPVPPVEREALPCCAPEDGREDRCLDQTKEAGSFEEPFFLNVATSLLDAQVQVVCVGGRYGLARRGSRLR